MSDCSAHRVPRAGLDPIDGPAAALAIIRLAVRSPSRSETIVLLLDHDRRGLGVTVVSDTDRPDDVVEVVECIARAAAGTGRVAAMVVTSVRPGASASDPDDPDRWLEMSDLADSAGVELVEWFVIGRDTVCPRDLLGAMPRW